MSHYSYVIHPITQKKFNRKISNDLHKEHHPSDKWYFNIVKTNNFLSLQVYHVLPKLISHDSIDEVLWSSQLFFRSPGS